MTLELWILWALVLVSGLVATVGECECDFFEAIPEEELEEGYD